MSRKPPNWEKTGTVAGYAEYLRKQSRAFVVVVIRRDDAVMAVDPDVMPRDAEQLLRDHLPSLAIDLEHARKDGRKAGRVEMGPVTE
ncbi:MAG: hypothetical protein KGL39_43215 [Patescibacteria group bacterium]|nr:hypothetical protein [Patescibacteria group bacterium]